MEIWLNMKTVTNGSISNVLVFSTVMTNGHALLVCETEVFIQPFSFPFLDSEFIPSPPPVNYIYINTPEVN